MNESQLLGLRVKLDDELLVDDRRNLFARGDAGDGAGELVFVHGQPVRHRNDGGQFHVLGRKAAAAVLGFHGDDVTRIARAARDRALASVDSHVTMADHLTGGITAVGEAKAVNDAVEAGLKKLEKDFTGNAAALAGDLEETAELALEQTVLITELLLFRESDGILARFTATALRAMLPRRIILALEVFGRAEQRDVVAAGNFVFGSGITCHLSVILN